MILSAREESKSLVIPTLGEEGTTLKEMVYCYSTEWPMLHMPHDAAKSSFTPILTPVYFDMLYDEDMYRANSLPALMEQFMSLCSDAGEQGLLAAGFTVEACGHIMGEEFMAWATKTCSPRVYVPNDPAKDQCLAEGALSGEVQDPTIASASEERVASLRILIQEQMLPQRHGSMWANYYNDVVAFLEQHFEKHPHLAAGSRAPMVVEVGTAFGGLADHILGEMREVSLIAVDPLEPNYAADDVTASAYASSSASLGIATVKEFAEAWGDSMKLNLQERHGCRYHLLRNTSVRGSRSVADQSVAAVFVDGLHTYEGVAADILAWLPKLQRPGGVMIFNDYDSGDGEGLGGVRSTGFPEVAMAVHDLAKTHGRRVIVGSKDKPPGRGNAAIVF